MLYTVKDNDREKVYENQTRENIIDLIVNIVTSDMAFVFEYDEQETEMYQELALMDDKELIEQIEQLDFTVTAVS